MDGLLISGLILVVVGFSLTNRDLKQKVKELEEMLEEQQQEENPDQSQ